MTSQAIMGVLVTIVGLGIIGWALGKVFAARSVPASLPVSSGDPVSLNGSADSSAPLNDVRVAPLPVVRMGTIIGGVFWGMMLFSLVGAILWFIVTHLPG
ncbi:MAG TPA: hypothetical protein VHX37_13430 [Acidobacteriaceae bacterium]|nr:hypothetical protein [Acidobacteriaceae bacterium]